EASDAGIQNKKWWEKLIEWFSDAWDTLVEICKVIVAVLGVVVMIIGGPLAWVVLAAAVVVLADTLIKFAQGKAGLLDVAFAALDCIPGLKGLTTLGGLARGLRGGLGAARAGLRGVAGGLRGIGTSLSRGAANLRGNAVELLNRFTCGDPVDVVSGDVVMLIRDVELPGTLPLEVERAHVSSYRCGRWFGPSWSSTFDQRLEIEADGVRYAAPDGVVLGYPVPEPGVPTLPKEGPRWPLTWDGTADGEMLIEIPEERRSLVFRPGGGPAWQGVFETLILPISEVVARDGQRVTFEYGQDGAPTGVRHSGGYHLAVETDGHRITALSAPATGETLMRYGYDPLGRLTEVFNSSGLPLRMTYDGAGRIAGWADRTGSRYSYSYDEEGRCQRAEGSDGFLSAVLRHDREARVTVALDSAGQPTEYRYNERGQVVAVTDPLDGVTRNEWDRYDRLLARTDPLGRTTRYGWNDEGCLVSVERPDGTTVTAEYDGPGRPTVVVNPDGTRHHHTYDALGRLTGSTNPLGVTEHYTWDDDGSLNGVVDAVGEVHRVRCDGTGQPVEVTDPLGGTIRYRYDPLGRLVEVVDPVGGVTTLGWTPERRLASRTHPGGETERWEYDPDGNQLLHVDAAGLTHRQEFGPFGRITARVDPAGGRREFRHDTELRVTEILDPAGLAWRYAYDAAGSLVRETDVNGRSVHYRWDAAGQLTERVNGAGEAVGYRYDPLGNMVERTGHGVAATFAYDPMGRIVAARNATATMTLVRDALGRLTEETTNGRTLRLGWDATGRRRRRETPSGAVSLWSHDPADRPTALTLAGHALEFRHDRAARPTGLSTALGPVLEQHWNADHLLTEQRFAGGRRSWEYRGDGTPTALRQPQGTERRFDLDENGRVRVVRDGDGTVLESYAWDASGNVAAESASPREVHGTLLLREGSFGYVNDAEGRVVERVRHTASGDTETWHHHWNAENQLTELTTPDGTRWAYGYDPFGRRISKRRLARDGSEVERVTYVWDDTVLAEQRTVVPGGAGALAKAGERVTTWEWSPGDQRPVAQLDRVTLSPDEVDQRFHAIVSDLVGTPTELLAPDGAVAWRAPAATLWGLPTGERADEGALDCPLRFPGQSLDTESGLHYNVHRYYDPATARYLSPDPWGLVPGPHHFGYVPNPLIWLDPFGLAGGIAYVLKGRAGIRRAEADLRASGHTVVAKEVRIQANGAPGINAYVDIVARDPQGQLVLIEVKNGARAPFTRNQRIVYPRLPTTGGTVTSDRLAGVGAPRGTLIPAGTSVQVIRYP
ncbi:RHS repeat-associated core domain-containing protein, partial [Streptomyces zhaozhouensis]